VREGNSGLANADIAQPAGLRLVLPKNAQTEKSRATGLEQALRQTQAEGL
jgi:phage tail protein X